MEKKQVFFSSHTPFMQPFISSNVIPFIKRIEK